MKDTNKDYFKAKSFPKGLFRFEGVWVNDKPIDNIVVNKTDNKVTVNYEDESAYEVNAEFNLDNNNNTVISKIKNKWNNEEEYSNNSGMEALIAMLISNSSGPISETPPYKAKYVNDDASYVNPDIDKDVPQANTFSGYSYTVWRDQIPEAVKPHYTKLIFTDETFDTITEYWYDNESTAYEVPIIKSKIFGVGIWHKGQDDEEVIRLIFPDGSWTLLEGW